MQKKLFSLLLVGKILFTVSEVEQLKIGNFALPASQQPGPLVGFGQNMVDKGDLQFFTYVDWLAGNNKNYIRVIPSILYGIKDNFSIFIEFPVAAKFQLNDIVLRGLQNLSIQLEYAIYDHITIDTTTQITWVTNMTIPASSTVQIPIVSYGSPTFFIGSTASHFTTRWYSFVALGAMITTEHEMTKFGNQFFYQAGLSRNIGFVADEWLCNITVELDGIYTEKTVLDGTLYPNWGGNTIELGPSIWFSTPHLSVQVGISGFVYQNLFGIQNKNSYELFVDVGWKF